MKLPKGLRKYIRTAKSRIRRGGFDLKTQEKLISEALQKVSAKK